MSVVSVFVLAIHKCAYPQPGLALILRGWYLIIRISRVEITLSVIAHILGILLMNSYNTDNFLATTIICSLSALNM